MAVAQKDPSIQDIINGATADIPGAPASLTAAMAPSPTLAPSGDAYAQSVAPKPTLGTDAELQAPAMAASPASDTSGPAPSSITLPAKNSDNESSLGTDSQPSFLSRLARIAAGATGTTALTTPGSSPESKGAAIAHLLGGIGTAGALATGSPQQKQVAIEQEKIPLQMAQIQNEMAYRNGMLGLKGQANENTATKTGLQYGPGGTSRISADASAQRADASSQMADERTKQIEASLNGQVFALPELAHLAGRDDLAGKMLSPIQAQQQLYNPIKARGISIQDVGPEGKFAVDRAGQRIARIGDSPQLLANQRYMNRPVQAIDPRDGQLKWMVGTDAVNLGAAPGSQGAQIMSKQAQFKDIYSGLGNMRQAIAEIGKEPLDAGTIAKLTLATRETDPTVSHQLFDTILGTQNLTPAQQDFVIATQQLNERALSLRNLAGMGNASDQVRAAIRATLPNAKSGNAPMMLKQLDAVTNLVDNLYSGVPRVNTGPKTPTAASGGQSGGSNANSGGNPSGTLYQFPDGSHRMVPASKEAAAEGLGAKKAQ